ncbi:MAG: hypothetical protein JWR10_31 [Rubritepida sp.]|nr:hypothetical protein [Rubritepida sp.]
MANTPDTGTGKEPHGTKVSEILPPRQRETPTLAASPHAGDATSLAAPTHPEEMKATFAIRFGSSGTLEATARCTPAGLVTVGIMVSSILLSVASVIWAARRPK